jgi:hypothetical protein
MDWVVILPMLAVARKQSADSGNVKTRRASRQQGGKLVLKKDTPEEPPNRFFAYPSLAELVEADHAAEVAVLVV